MLALTAMLIKRRKKMKILGRLKMRPRQPRKRNKHKKIRVQLPKQTTKI